MRFRVAAFALLLPSAALAQTSPAKMGIASTTVPEVLQVLDNTDAWVSIGTVDSTAHTFSLKATTLNSITLGDGTYPMFLTGFPEASSSNPFVYLGMYPPGNTSGVFTAYNGIGFHLGYGGYFGVTMDRPGYYGFNTSNNYLFGHPDIALTSNDPASTGQSVAAFRDIGSPISPSAVQVYNTWTNNSNGEWGALDWQTTANTLTIGAQANGTGTVRPVNIVGNPVTINGLPTGPITANVTPTSGFSGQRVMISDGSKTQALTPNGQYADLGDSTYHLYVLSRTTGLIGSAEPMIQFTCCGFDVYGIGMALAPTSGWTGFSMSASNTNNGVGAYGFNSTNNYTGQTPDVAFTDEDTTGTPLSIAGFRSLSTPTSPSALRVYNTRSNPSNGEWGALDWLTTPNTLTIGAQANGTGTLRPVNIVGSALTFNGGALGTVAAGVTPTTGFNPGEAVVSDGTKIQSGATNWTRANVAAASVPVYYIGTNSYPSSLQITAAIGAGPSNYGMGLNVYPDGGAGIDLDNSPATKGYYGFANTTNNINGGPDIMLASDGASIATIRGVSPATFRIDNTYTNAANGEWATIDWTTAANTLTIGTAANGTGSVRSMEFLLGGPAIWILE